MDKKEKTPPPAIVKFKFIGEEPVNFSAGDKDFVLHKNDECELPENAFVKGLEAQCFLERVKVAATTSTEKSSTEKTK